MTRDGRANFDRIRYRRHDPSVFLYAFAQIELNGDDLRRDPLEVRKTTLASVLAKAGPGLRLMSTLSTTTARWFFAMPASSGSKASCPSARAHPTAPVARSIDSR